MYTNVRAMTKEFILIKMLTAEHSKIDRNIEIDDSISKTKKINQKDEIHTDSIDSHQFNREFYSSQFQIYC